MEKIYDIMALGELLIDFTEAGSSKGGLKLFEQNPGGAPANLLTAASHMGCRTAFIGKVGADMHGDFLKETLHKERIDTTYLLQDETVFTTLAFVAIGENGERQFSFARKPGADTCLREEELNIPAIQKTKVFHIGSLSLTDEPARTASYAAVKAAKESGAVISYDPNYRSTLWKSKEEAIRMMQEMIPFADVMKVSDEESVLLTGEADYGKAAEKLLCMGPKLIAVTLGSRGVFLAVKGRQKLGEVIPGFAVNAVDTTGAGDSFWGGFLSEFIKYDKEIAELSWEEWKNCAVFGNATAALCVEKRGGIPAMPMAEEVKEVLRGSSI